VGREGSRAGSNVRTAKILAFRCVLKYILTNFLIVCSVLGGVFVDSKNS
jgi:hypothetical protein